MDGLSPTHRKLHPLVATAAVAVTVASVLGAIVLITDQVAAHRAREAAAVASNDASAAPATAPAEAPAAQTASQPEKAIAPLPAPTRRPAPAPAKPKTSTTTAMADAGYPPPPPAGVQAAPPEVAAPPPPAPPVCADCGVVAGVRVVKTPGQGSAVGVLGGGAVGGLVGNQFGSGRGKDAMTILGVIGGAVAGNQVEKQVKATSHYEVDVRLDNGQLRTISMPADPGPIVGTRVRIENGQLVREAAPQS